MKIEGKVSTIIFKNDKNSWTVMLVKSGEEYITAVGDTEELEVDDEISLEGEVITHKVYGEQFKFTTYKKLLPKTNKALIDYISENIKGIGKKKATSILDSFGEDTVNVIRYNPEKLESIKGLNNTKIQALSLLFNEEWEKWNVIDYLSIYNISVVVASKIYKVLGENTINIIKDNPYNLLLFIKALDFKSVDIIGKNIGIALDNSYRIDSGILYSLNQITDFGHTCIELLNLIKYALEFLGVCENVIIDSIERLKFNEKLYVQEIEEVEYVFKRSYFLAEDHIAKVVAKHATITSNIDYSKKIDEVSKRNNITLSDEQTEAIATCLNSSISIITGGPGTGKTTIIKCIIDILEDIEKKYVLCAPTGRAAKRITQTTSKEAKTIHRLLEITKIDDNTDNFLDLEVKQIEEDVLIVDEASMIDTLMMNNLCKAINDNTKIIIVGDANQLPSVGAGNVLKDIIDAEIINTIYLKQIYRQSAKSDIIVNAHKVNKGEYPIFKNKNTDLFYIKTDSIKDTLTEISSLVSYRLESFAKLDVLKDLQILTPMKKTELGTIELNTTIQNILNAKSSIKKEKEYNGKLFREGDKVMQVTNNYDKKFSIDGEFFDGIYNGDIGYITKIDNAEERLYIIFDETKLVEYDFDELDELEHAYAVTIHKSQGSEFDYVILPLYTGYSKLFTRNLLYTAMTRAKKMLVIVGSINTINFMIDNIDSNNRKTGLKYKILEQIKK